ncbi:MAG: hypothetical protein AB7V50_08475 [Vampirovibrionia bacterium]
MKHILSILLLFIILLSSCDSTNKYSYDYTQLESIAMDIKNLYSEMNSIYYSPDSRLTWIKSKENLSSKLETIQEAIDNLPPVEKPPEEKGAKQFNELLYSARTTYNKLLDINYLFYDTINYGDYNYFEKVITDKALEPRINNLIERCQNKGINTPLDMEYQNLLPPSTTENANITVEYSNIKTEESE